VSTGRPPYSIHVSAIRLAVSASRFCCSAWLRPFHSSWPCVFFEYQSVAWRRFWSSAGVMSGLAAYWAMTFRTLGSERAGLFLPRIWVINESMNPENEP
jgi:hypothetical protein